MTNLTDTITPFTDNFKRSASFSFLLPLHYLALADNKIKSMNNSVKTMTNNADDYLHTTTFFGGIKRIIISKSFKGGKISNIFGGTELDFTHADLTGVAVLDITQVFGEVKLTVPTDWRVEADASHFCSVVDDDRSYTSKANNSDKVLLIKGISIFGVIDVLNA